MNANPEVLGLIETLHKAEQRLQELTAGEVDSVMSGGGQTLLLRQAQDELRDSETLKRAVILKLQSANEELETFSHSISHDLRAPLRHILYFAELLQQEAGPALTGENLRYLATICQSATRMEELIDDLLKFSHMGRVDLQKTDVDTDELVAEVLADFAAETARRNIVWQIHPLPPVRADRALLRLALVNLIANAVKFTGPRTEPRIEVGCIPGDSSETVIFIRDNGVGFDRQYADKLFGVFQRLHSAAEFEGTGVGLANVQRIVQRHGGRTWAQGTVEGGATFYFSIPQSAANS